MWYRIKVALPGGTVAYPDLHVRPPLTAVLFVRAIDRPAAVRQVKTVSVSADYKTVTLRGGVGDGGFFYPEWEILNIRKVNPRRDPANRIEE